MRRAAAPYTPLYLLAAVDRQYLARDELARRCHQVDRRFRHVPDIAAPVHWIGLMEALQGFVRIDVEPLCREHELNRLGGSPVVLDQEHGLRAGWRRLGASSPTPPAPIPPASTPLTLRNGAAFLFGGERQLYPSLPDLDGYQVWVPGRPGMA